MKIFQVTAVLTCFLVVGCATNPPLYTWGKYESSLYKYYKKPETLSKHVENLEDVIVKGEKANNVAPGIYAEAGYAYLTLGDSARAVEFFEKEKNKWPESEQLMDKMIESAVLSRSGGDDSES